MSGLSSSTLQVVEDAVLDLAELVVVLVEDVLGLGDVDLGAGALGPGQNGEPFDVVAGERVVGRHGRHARQARQFLERFLLHVLGHAGIVDLLAQLFDLALALVLLAQFLLDGLHLLAQVVVALRLLHLVLHFVLDLGAQLLHLDFLGQMLVEQFEAGVDARSLEQFLLLVRGQERQRGGDEVHQAAGLVDIGGDGPQFVGKGRRLGDDLLELRNHDAHQGFDIGRRLRLLGFEGLHLGDHEGLGLDEADQRARAPRPR